MDSKERKFKFSYGEKVRLKSMEEICEIVGISYEYTFDEGEKYESTYYAVRSKSGKLFDLLAEDELEPLKLAERKDDGKLNLRKKNLTKKEIDDLLDLYNDYMSIYKLNTSLGIESDYLKECNEIIDYLNEATTVKK